MSQPDRPHIPTNSIEISFTLRYTHFNWFKEFQQCIHLHHNQDTKHFHFPYKVPSFFFLVNHPPHASSQANTEQFSVDKFLFLPIIILNKQNQTLSTLMSDLLKLSMLLRFIHAVVCKGCYFLVTKSCLIRLRFHGL